VLRKKTKHPNGFGYVKRENPWGVPNLEAIGGDNVATFTQAQNHVEIYRFCFKKSHLH